MKILATDIISHVNKGKEKHVYGRKGERVSVVANHGNVVIVELRGNRFSVKKKELV